MVFIWVFRFRVVAAFSASNVQRKFAIQPASNGLMCCFGIQFYWFFVGWLWSAFEHNNHCIAFSYCSVLRIVDHDHRQSEENEKFFLFTYASAQAYVLSHIALLRHTYVCTTTKTYHRNGIKMNKWIEWMGEYRVSATVQIITMQKWK